jgi:CubicO group peptidase (beta-lactamase class C family)
MARFGQLYLGMGEWQGRRIIPAEWIEASTSPHSEALIKGEKAPYGYLWWLKEEGGLRCFMAQGDGGNLICCIPEEGLVVAIAAATAPGASDRGELIRDCIIPAIMK